MRRTRTVIIACILIFGLTPGLAALAVDPAPPTPLWGGGAVAEEASDEGSPRIDAGVVVWADGGAIRSKDLPTQTVGVVYDEGVSQAPDTGGGLVVWSEFSNDAEGDVWMKVLGGGAASAVAAGPGVAQVDPRTDGSVVVWREWTLEYGYVAKGLVLDGGATFTITTQDGVDSADVSGGVVAYTTAGEINAYDIAADDVFALAASTGVATSVAIDGDLVVWADDRGGTSDIYGYDRSVSYEFPICEDTGDQRAPAISGSLVVWQDDQGGGDTDICAYDLGRGQLYAVTDDAHPQTSPATDGSHIVWTDGRNAAVTGEDIWWIGYDTIAPTTTSDLQPSYLGSATISLFAEDDLFGSGVKKTWYKVNYAGDWYSGPFTFTRPGKSIPLHYKSYDMVDNLEEYNVEYFDLVSVDTTYTAISGPNRYDTAVATSEKAFPKGTSRVVIATGENWPDALGGAALAKAKRAAILLTLPTALPASVLEEIGRLKAKEAVILGGASAVSPEVEAALVQLLGEGKVTRIEGGNRYETADKVARATREAMGYSPTKVLVATGVNFPDALGASPLAALGPWPLVLAPPSSGLTDGTKATVKDIGAKYGVILGGESAVAPAVAAELETMLGKGKVSRLAGDTRYDTAIECAKFGVSHGLWWDGVALSTGANFPDALAGGMLQGQAGSVLLLTPPDALHPSVAAELTAQRDWIGNVTFLGGTAAVSESVRDQVKAILK